MSLCLKYQARSLSISSSVLTNLYDVGFLKNLNSTHEETDVHWLKILLGFPKAESDRQEESQPRLGPMSF